MTNAAPDSTGADSTRRELKISEVVINAGQMVYDVRYHVEGRVPVEHYGRLGGIVPSPGEILDKLKTML